MVPANIVMRYYTSHKSSCGKPSKMHLGEYCGGRGELVAISIWITYRENVKWGNRVMGQKSLVFFCATTRSSYYFEDKKKFKQFLCYGLSPRLRIFARCYN